MRKSIRKEPVNPALSSTRKPLRRNSEMLSIPRADLGGEGGRR